MEDICHIRLDFVTFELAQPRAEANIAFPNTATQCFDASFTAQSDGFEVPHICGINNGYHMFLEASHPCNELNVVFKAAAQRSFRILTSQIKCSDRNKRKFESLWEHCQ